MSISQPLGIFPLYNLESLTESLRAEGLPHADLYEPEREFFQLQQGDQLVGYVGIEGATADRLVRSFLVFRSHRREGIGSEALALLELLLVSRGVETLHLLTTTAAPFFQHHGFKIRARTTAPSAIQHTLEFRNLCPASANYMAKRIT